MLREYKQKRKRDDEIQIQMAKIEADKEFTLKEMELKVQAQTSSNVVVDPPPHNRDAKFPKLLPPFIDENDELDSYLFLMTITC